MKRYITIGLFMLCLVSCQEKNAVFFLHFLNTKKVDKLVLSTKKRGNIISYNYKNLTDSIKSIDLKYHLEKDVILMHKDTFWEISKTYTTKSYEYKMYQQKEIRSHNTTLVFHKKYGLLCSTAYGADFLFLKDSLQLKETKMIFKEVLLELNKIEK